MKESTRWQIFKDMLIKLWTYDPKIAFFMTFETIFQVTQAFIAILIPAWIISLITDRLKWHDFTIRMLLIFLVYGLIRWMSTYLKNRNEFQYLDVRTMKFFVPWLRFNEQLDYEYYEKDTTQQKMVESTEALFNGNHQGVEGVYHDLSNFSSSMLSLLLYTVLIGRISFIILIPIVVLSIISYVLYIKTHKLYYQRREIIRGTDVDCWYYDRLSYDTAVAKDIRLYKIQDMLKDKIYATNHKRAILTKNAENVLQIHTQVNVLLGFLRDGVSYLYLIHLIGRGQITLSEFVFYLGIISAFAQYFTTCSLALAKLNVDLDISKKYYNYLQDSNVTSRGNILQAEQVEIVFDNVSYKYPNSDRLILDGFSLKFAPNEKIALVGVNGAGKTTIVKLLSGLYTPTSGDIYVNGINLKDINKAEYFKHLAVVFQEPILFSMTIGENISGHPEGDYDENRVKLALKLAGLLDHIQNLPQGISSYLNKDIDEKGISLSGGQKQSLLLAKAYYKNPMLLILDEPTAALDAVAESQIYQKYNQISENKSALFISHRLASTRFCDRIIYLEDGKIIEEGTHEQLLAKKGHYASMYQIQAQYYQEGGEIDEA